jgi:Flp pilus assembly protein TadD
MDPTDVSALNNRGMAYLRRGKPEKARRDFEAALTFGPAFEQARQNLQAHHLPP